MLYLCVWCVFGVVGGLLGARHEKLGKGFILGFLFGPIGWVLALFDVGAGWLIAACVALGLLAIVAVPALLQIQEHDRSRALHNKGREEELTDEQDRHRAGGPRGPVMQMIDLEMAFEKEKPSEVIHTTFDVWWAENPVRGEIDYTLSDKREIRVFFVWDDERWKFNSAAVRKITFPLGDENVAGSETKVPPPAIAGFLTAHHLIDASPKVAAAPKATPSPAPRTPSPAEVLQQQTQRNRAEADSIARKYGAH